MLFTGLYMRVDILLTRVNHVHDYIIHQDPLTGEIWSHKSNLTSPLFIEVHVPNQEIERNVILCVRSIYSASFYHFSIGL
jgi:hypothetical protein